MTTTMMTLLNNPAIAVEPYDPDRRMAGKLRTSLILLSTLVFGLGGAATLIPIGAAVIGGGQIGVEQHVKRIAHPIGGTVAEILVHNGQHVRKGQVLIRLDDRVSGTDAAMAALTVDQMLAQKARLEAERLGASAIQFPASLAARKDAGALKAMADEQRMFTLRKSEEAGIRAQLASRVGQYDKQIIGYRAQITALQQQSALIEPERKGIQTLYEKRLVTLNRLNQLERTAVDLNGSIGSLNAQIAGTYARIAETREQIIQLSETRRADAGSQLSQINMQLNQQQVRSTSANDLHDRTTVRAPTDGVVEQLTVTTIGGVIRPAEPLLSIVPDKDRMVVEGSISPSDIDQVQVDQSARVRLSSLNNTATPELMGKVIYVGTDPVTQSDAQGTRSFFPVRIVIDPAQLKRNREVVLKQGMPAEIFIETGSRSMISYLTKPLQDQFARAFRD
ncbi:MAG: HlyD family type I secretion periplasmic adaptor subunit [Sphingobium sp.]